MKSDLDGISSDEWIRLALRTGFKAESLAHSCEISVRQLERYFLEAFRCSPKWWLRFLRVSLAAQLITQRQSGKEIASKLAFSSVSHFVSEFKKHYGCTPKDYLVESSQRTAREAMPPACRAFEEEQKSMAIHTRNRNILFEAHRNRLAHIGKN